MNRKDIYEITVKVEELYGMGGLGSEEPDHCLYADFAVDVAVRAIRLKLNEMANEVERMPFGDTGASFAKWIRSQE
jgi:hypothetical protein